MKLKKIVSTVVILFLTWVVITSAEQRFLCSECTETELFLLIPKNLMLEFTYNGTE